MMTNYTFEEITQFIEENDVKFIRLAFCDIFGTQKNISIMPRELARAFEEGISFDASSVRGFMNIEASDLLLFPDPRTLSVLPWRPSQGRVVRFFCDIRYPDGRPFEGDGRNMLRQAHKEMQKLGYSVKIGTECEFYLLQNDDFIQRLVAVMRQNQRSLVKEMLRTFVDSLALLQPSREQFLLQINQVLSALLDFAMEYGVTETAEKNSKLFSSDYIEISSVSEIQTELIRYGEQILQQVHLSKNSSNSAIVRRTKEYIKAHYQDDELCLEQIADALDVNLQYMCFLFKKQTDTTIGAYILQTRMEMAGKLFQRTNYNVTEVAQRVGFFDVSYFSKCFKKYFGVSPKQYQNVSSNYLKTT